MSGNRCAMPLQLPRYVNRCCFTPSDRVFTILDTVHAVRPTKEAAHGRYRRWTVFSVLFALMVVDYVDCQIVASMFPQVLSSDLATRRTGPLVRRCSQLYFPRDCEARSSGLSRRLPFWARP